MYSEVIIRSNGIQSISKLNIILKNIDLRAPVYCILITDDAMANDVGHETVPTYSDNIYK